MLKQKINPLKKKIIKKKNKIDIYDASHPLRQLAINIIEKIIEPVLQHGINGKKYYDLEDDLTLFLRKKLMNKLIS